MKTISKCAAAALAVALCGCGANYRWRPSVPDDMRTVAVPTFRNESDLQEIGAVAARQVLREFQREGTFRIRSTNESYDRRSGLRITGSTVTGTFRVSVVDKKAGKVLVDNRVYEARATYAANQDLTTAERDASNRLAEDLARQVVDDVLALEWEKEK